MIFSVSGIGMATWKKVVLGLLTVATVTIGGCLTLLDHLLSEMCVTTIINQTSSPSGKLKAVVFQVDCVLLAISIATWPSCQGIRTSQRKTHYPKVFSLLTAITVEPLKAKNMGQSFD